MHDIRHQDDRNGEIRKEAVCFLDQGQQSELRDAEIHQTADQCDHDLAGGDLLFSGRSAGVCRIFFQTIRHTLDHGSNHIDCGGDGTKDDQDGDERCHKSFSNAILHDQKRRDTGICHLWASRG